MKLRSDWKLWLDDQLDDPDCPDRHMPFGYFGAKSSQEAINLVISIGPPDFMDLDHDLGQGDDAMVFLKFLADYCFGSPPDYRVHSQNPEGRKNIIAFMESWKKSN